MRWTTTEIGESDEARGVELAAVATGSGQVATWTVLFTDMVGSTEFRVRVGEVAFDRVRADLDRRVARRDRRPRRGGGEVDR